MTAAELILKKALVASNLDSKEWNTIQAALRNRAFFSSCIAEANILQAMRHRAAEYAARGVDISEARKQMRADLERMHYAPKEGEEGTIKDLFSEARLNVILKHNLDQARGMIQRASGMTPGAFAAFPALEFKRIHHRKNKRTTWAERWRKAGGKLYGGKMIALKTDPVWIKISVFGNPFPPFDWGSGMGVIDVDRKTAIEIGLVSDEKLREETAALRNQRSEASKFNDNLQAKVPNLRSDSLCAEILHKNFGDQIAIQNSVVNWQGNLIQDVLSGKIKKASLGVNRSGQKLSISHQFFKEHGSKHLNPNEPYEHLTKEDLELLPALWHKPDRILGTRDPNREQYELDLFDGGILVAIIDKRNGLKSIQKRISPKGSTT